MRGTIKLQVMNETTSPASTPQPLDDGGEAARPHDELGVGKAFLPVDDADFPAEEPLSAPAELQRCDRDKHRPAPPSRRQLPIVLRSHLATCVRKSVSTSRAS
jgi:hypothetical protein